MAGKLAEALVRAGVLAADAYDIEEELGLRKDNSVNLTATLSDGGNGKMGAKGVQYSGLQGWLPTTRTYRPLRSAVVKSFNGRDNDRTDGGTVRKHDAFGIVLRYPNGRIAHIFRRSTAHAAIPAEVRIQFYGESSFAGQTGEWGKSSLFYANESDCRCVGGLVTEAGTVLVLLGDVYSGGEMNRMRCFRSTDSGETWAQSDDYVFPGWQESAIYHPAVQASDGIIYQPAFSAITNKHGVHLWQSTDDGLTWQPGPTISAQQSIARNETAVAYLGSRVMIAIMRTGLTSGQKGTWDIARSTNNGVTWTVVGAATLEANAEFVSPLLEVWTNANGILMVSFYYGERTQNKSYYRTATAESLVSGTDILGPAWSAAIELHPYRLAYPNVVTDPFVPARKLVTTYDESASYECNLVTSTINVPLA